MRNERDWNIIFLKGPKGTFAIKTDLNEGWKWTVNEGAQSNQRELFQDFSKSINDTEKNAKNMI